MTVTGDPVGLFEVDPGATHPRAHPSCQEHGFDART